MFGEGQSVLTPVNDSMSGSISYERRMPGELLAKSEYVAEENDGFRWRSVIVGTLIGCVLAAQNVYFGLRNGMSFGDGMVAAVIGYGIMKNLIKYFPNQFAGKFKLHEHVILQTAAAANISIIFSGGFSQYILAMSPDVQGANQLGDIEQTWTPTYWQGLLWLVLAGYLGFFVSQPYRYRLIVQQDLPWPSPTATAMVMKALHGDNEDGVELSKKVNTATLCAFVWQWFKWMFDGAQQMSKWPIFGAAAAKYSWYTDWSPAYMGSGMLTTPNAVLSMMLGAIYGFGILFPLAESYRGVDGWYAESASGIDGAKAYWFLPSLAMLVTDSLYQSIKVGYVTIKEVCGPMMSEFVADLKIDDEDANRLVPRKFWLPAFIINVIVVIAIVPIFFPIQWYLIAPVILVAIPVGYGVCLGGAITGTFLISAVGKLIIIIFGSISGSVLGALWLSGVGMITVGSTEQVLVDYQVAHMTGTSPRKMFMAQMIAATVGFIVTPLSYSLFMQAFEITEDGLFSAPGGTGLRSLAVIMVDGVSQLPGNLIYFIVPSVALSISLSIIRDIVPEKHQKYVPNALAFAIGFFVNASFPLNNFFGLLLRTLYQHKYPESEKKFIHVIAGGMIAGEGLAAISQAIFAIAGVSSPTEMAMTFSAYQ